jgi:branched-chain amino acid transport system substrate-binding protein
LGAALSTPFVSQSLAVIDQCDVVITNVSSASTAVLLPLAAELGVLILDASPGMSRRSGAFDIHLGARPIDYLSRSIPAAMSEFDARDWVIIGSDYIWPHRIGALASQVISSHQGRVRDTITVPLGAREFDAELERIAGSGAQLILSSLVGIDAALFERAAYARGLRNDIRTLVVNMDNAVLEHTGSEAAAGLWALHDRFLGAASDSPEFNYQARFGCEPPLLSGMAQNCADAVSLYAEAVRRGGSSEANHVRQEIVRLLDPTAESKSSRRGYGISVPVDVTEITRQGQRTVLAS